MTPDGAGGTSWNVYDGVTTTKKFWWDQFNNIPGPCAQSWKQNTVKTGLPYDNLIIGWSQGEADATVMSGLADDAARATYAATYKASLKLLFAQLRSWTGQSAPILIQPLGRQSGTDVPIRQLRLVQSQVASEVASVFIGAETTHLTRQDSVHFGKGPADPDGFDRGAHQLARACGDIMRTGGTGAATKWRGPAMSALSKVDANTIDVTLAWPSQAGGSDFAAQDGSTSGLVGFEVVDGAGSRTVSGASRQAANVVRLVVSGAALSGTVTVNHNPTPSALDRLKMVVDNNAGLPLALQAGVLSIAA